MEQNNWQAIFGAIKGKSPTRLVIDDDGKGFELYFGDTCLKVNASATYDEFWLDVAIKSDSKQRIFE